MIAWCRQPFTKNYDKNSGNLHVRQEFNGVNYNASLYGSYNHPFHDK